MTRLLTVSIAAFALALPAAAMAQESAEVTEFTVAGIPARAMEGRG